MKKVRIVGAQASRKISAQKLTIGLDLGDRSSWYCVLDEAGTIVLEQKVSTTAKTLQEVFGGMPQPDRAGDRDALALDQPFARRVGARSDRGECPQAAVDWESRKKDDRLDAPDAGPHRSRVAESSEASQPAGASRSDCPFSQHRVVPGFL